MSNQKIRSAKNLFCGVRGGTVPQTGRSRVRFPIGSLRYFVHLILSRVSPGGKCSRSAGLKTLPSSLSRNSGSLNLLQTKGPVRAPNGRALPLTIYFVWMLEGH
jgi:hypothetical protein